jgi:hypothetical protein
VTATARMPDEVFSGVLDILVTRAAPGAASFADLLGAVAGAYPGDVRACLGRLTAAGLLDAASTIRLMAPALPGEAPSAAAPARDTASVLPDPHPLDFDWRFDTGTVDAILARCVAATIPGEVITLLGCPSLLEAAVAADTGRRFVLLEASAATCAALSGVAGRQVVRCDLARDPLPPLSAGLVVADPPWYPAPTRAFLWAAAAVSSSGASVLLAQPGLATRPGILAERAEALAFAAATGMRLASVALGALGYSSPPFERRALDADGLSAIPNCWRRGDLIELRRVSPLVSPRPEPEITERWVEAWIGRARLRIRADTGENRRLAADPHRADPRLVRLVPGDVLPTVSRRDPVRSVVAVWTGSNRVFGCRDPRLLAAIARALAEAADPVSAAASAAGRILLPGEARHAAVAARQLALLADAENCDITPVPGTSVVASAPLSLEGMPQ